MRSFKSRKYDDKVNETICLLADEINKLRRENEMLKRLVREGIRLMERHINSCKHNKRL